MPAHHAPASPRRRQVLGYLLMSLGGALWLAAVVSVLRDPRTPRRRRLLTAAVLAACVPAAILYWLLSAP